MTAEEWGDVVVCFWNITTALLTDLGRNRSNLPGAPLICVRSTVQAV